jgi:dephospho-CoA kinase
MKSPLKLVALVGMPGAGKSVAADFFRKKRIPVLRFGDQTEIGVRALGLPINEKNERDYRESLRNELGMSAMAIKIEPRIIAATENSSVIVLDGLYSWEEYVYLKEKFPHIILLCIYATPKIRYDRLAVRKIRPLTFDEAKSRDVAEIENLNKGGPIAIADYCIKNEGDPGVFIKELEKFYEKL